MMFSNKQIKAPLFRDPFFDGASDQTVLWVEEEHAWIFYFGHPYAAQEGEIEGLGARTVIQAARLVTDGSNLYCFRDS